jgi:hypothetical protein
MSARYSIGIDLGTSNCVLSYVDLASASKKSFVLPISQLSSATTWEKKDLLPSVCYLPFEGAELEVASSEWVVGTLALKESQDAPDRTISSAKSWLSHQGISMHNRFLPWNSETVASEKKLSPILASSLFLKTLKDEWNRSENLPPFNEQLITITVPASFDEAAQSYTLQAAEAANYPSVTLIEEPQAAFYFFLEEHFSFYQRSLLPRRPLTILVCDVGGGTTDFSLFHLDNDGELERVEVSAHTLLGGDNIDLAVAHAIEKELAAPLTPKQWQHVLTSARHIKQKALTESHKPENIFSVSVPPDGGGLFASTVGGSISRASIESLIMDGFFPECGRSAKIKHSGLREIGLPYAHDSAITRHLSYFLKGRKVDVLLCTGGTLIPLKLQQRIVEQIKSWQDSAPLLLPNSSMELAVARGAARYRTALVGASTQIKSGYPHSIYLLVNVDESSQIALCLLPKGATPGDIYIAEHQQLKALLGTEVQIQLLTAKEYPADQPGDRRNVTNSFHPLPPFSAFLKCQLRERGKTCVVNMQASINETGLLVLKLLELNGDQSWEVAVGLRSDLPHKTQLQGQQDSKGESSALEHLQTIWGKSSGKATVFNTPKNIFSELETRVGIKRNQWEAVLLRTLWGGLLPGITRRNRSVLHEERFFALAGYLLRPGYGVTLDKLRIAELWRCVQLGLSHPKERRVLVQWWIMWRRVAGGLDASQQNAIFRTVESMLYKEAECLRLAASLELLPSKVKETIGAKLCNIFLKNPNRTSSHEVWAFKRLIARVPLSTDALTIPPAKIQQWFDNLESLIRQRSDLAEAFLYGFECSGVREREIEISYKERLQRYLKLHKLSSAPLWEITPRNKDDIQTTFGESLPFGLQLVN